MPGSATQPERRRARRQCPARARSNRRRPGCRDPRRRPAREPGRRRRARAPGRRVHPAKDVEQRPRGRHHVVERAEDRGLLHGLADLARVRAAEVKRDGAEAQLRSSASPASNSAPPIPSSAPAAEEPAADRLADPLEPDRDECAEEDPGGNRDGRRVSRLRPVGEQRRTDAGAERGSGDESSERQGAGDQAALVPDCTEREGEEDDADVDQVQAEFIIVRPGGATTLSPRELRVVRATRRDSQSYRRDRARLSTQRARNAAGASSNGPYPSSSSPRRRSSVARSSPRSRSPPRPSACSTPGSGATTRRCTPS